MRRLDFAVLFIILVISMFSFTLPQTKAAPDLEPLVPSEVNVLVVSPANIYQKGASYLIADLTRYGFNVTQHASDDSAVNYVTESKTSDLSQYKVVILQGSSAGLPPVQVSLDEVNHFVNYGGVLILIGDALFRDETTGTWWNSPDPFSSVPVQRIDQRLGATFTNFFGNVGGAPYWDNNGTFTQVNNLIRGLPTSLPYVTANTSPVFQLELTTAPENIVYDFTSTSGTGGKKTPGVTLYRNATGSVGIYIQGSYIYAQESGVNQIRYFGLTEIAGRAQMLPSLIAHALGRDIETIIKPQPLATIRLGNLGGYGLTDALQQDDTYLNAGLSYFNTVVASDRITPTITFTDRPNFKTDYWQVVAPNALALLKGKYRNWEYSSPLRNENVTLMTATQIETLIDNIKDNYTSTGLDLFSTIIAPLGLWNDATLSAMINKNLTLIDVPDNPYQEDWNLQVNSTVIVHKWAQLASGAIENFTQLNKDFLNSQYFGSRDKWALATINGFPEFVYDVRNFRFDEVGTYSLQTFYQNLTSENPDIKFVSLMEAGLYFGNKWMKMVNPTRVGSTIEFDVDGSEIPDVVGIGKGMLWLKINSAEAIKDVSIDNKSWYYFDDHTIRLPAPTNSVHIKVTLGGSITPRVVGTEYKVVDTTWDIYRFIVSVVATPRLNVTIRLFAPNRGVFTGDQWTVFSSASEWDYMFDNSSRVVTFWAISDGLITFQVGPDAAPPSIWNINQSRPVYNSSVTITADIADMQTNVSIAILSYFRLGWVNVTMVPEDGLYSAEIPVFPYGTVVVYRLYASDGIGNWRRTEFFRYNVTDPFPPEIGTPDLIPANPSAAEPITVEVSVDEPLFASGVSRVTLWYIVGRPFGAFQSVNMTIENGTWEATIPGQDSGKEIDLMIEAYDRAGNRGTKESIIYIAGQSGATPVVPLPLLILSLAIVGALIAVGVYFFKFKRNKDRKMKKETTEKMTK